VDHDGVDVDVVGDVAANVDGDGDVEVVGRELTQPARHAPSSPIQVPIPALRLVVR